MQLFKVALSLFAVVLCLGMSPHGADAFAEDPVAMVVIDRSGEVEPELVAQWQTRVKRSFNFPDYKVLPQEEVNAALGNNLPPLDKKRPFLKKEQLASIAARIPAELVIAIWVDRMDEWTIDSFSPWGDTVQQVIVRMDVTAWRKADGQYLYKNVYYNETRAWGNSTPADEVSIDKLTDIIMYFKTQLPRIEKPAA